MTEGWLRRQAIWRHNGLVGRLLGARGLMHAIMQAETTTEESKRMASALVEPLTKLVESMKTRSDHQRRNR